MSRAEHLTGILMEIAEELGDGVALTLSKERGGREIYIPKNPKPTHELSKVVGLEAAESLSKMLGHGNLEIPCGPMRGEAGRRSRIKDLWNSGKSNAQIAAEVDVHIRTVERVVASIKSDDQLDLPF